MRYNHMEEKLFEALLEKSESNLIDEALKEWDPYQCETRNNGIHYECHCGQKHLYYLYTIKNSKNGNTLFPVGSDCIINFIDKKLHSKLNTLKKYVINGWLNPATFEGIRLYEESKKEYRRYLQKERDLREKEIRDQIKLIEAERERIRQEEWERQVTEENQILEALQYRPIEIISIFLSMRKLSGVYRYLDISIMDSRFAEAIMKYIRGEDLKTATREIIREHGRDWVDPDNYLHLASEIMDWATQYEFRYCGYENDDLQKTLAADIVTRWDIERLIYISYTYLDKQYSKRKKV